MKEFPADLCKFEEYKVPDENWWDGHELSRIDVSNNQIETIPRDIGQQQTLAHLNLSGNKIELLPNEIFDI
jgi:Leucine-rich repeat (LRR) protein